MEVRDPPGCNREMLVVFEEECNKAWQGKMHDGSWDVIHTELM
jgi:hypothetical protein